MIECHDGELVHLFDAKELKATKVRKNALEGGSFSPSEMERLRNLFGEDRVEHAVSCIENLRYHHGEDDLDKLIEMYVTTQIEDCQDDPP